MLRESTLTRQTNRQDQMKNKKTIKKTQNRIAKKRVAIAPIKKTTTTNTKLAGSRFDKIEDTDSVTLRLSQPQRVNNRLTFMPRSTQDRRVREWTAEETKIAIEWYKKGFS